MFQAVIRRAQVAVDQTIDSAVNRAIMVIPFVVAGGFATAALSYRLTSAYGAENAYWLMAGVFSVVGALAAVVIYAQRPADASESDSSQVASEANSTEGVAAEEPVLDPADREMMMGALSSLAPLALPHALKFIMRNLPLLVALAAALFVLIRANNTVSDPSQPQATP